MAPGGERGKGLGQGPRRETLCRKESGFHALSSPICPRKTPGPAQERGRGMSSAVSGENPDKTGRSSDQELAASALMTRAGTWEKGLDVILR